MSARLNDSELPKYLNVAKEAAIEAGNILKKSFGYANITHQKSERGVDVVTQLDIDTENLLAKRLMSFDNNAGFYGEEFGERQKGDFFWLVDPIDGTSHFVRGIPYCTSMIALVYKGQVIVSVIYNFVTDELFEATKGEGSKLNGKPINVSTRSLKDSYIAFESDLVRKSSMEKFLSLRRKSTLLTTINCGYEYGLIASGKLEGRICVEPYGKDWDYAPGSLLVSEAGGKVANIGSNDYDYTNHSFLATNSFVFDELTKGDNSLFPVN